MKLLTDEAVISALTQAFQDKPAGGLYPEEFRNVVSEMQEDIVRCKNCRWWNPFDRTCKNINYDEYMVTPAGFYCGWGERIDNEA